MTIIAIDMIHFDTLKYVETLQAAGISEPHAKAFSKVQQQVLSECIETTLPNKLATKADLAKLDAKFDKLEKRVAKLEADVHVIKWMLGFLLAGMVPLYVGGALLVFEYLLH